MGKIRKPNYKRKDRKNTFLNVILGQNNYRPNRNLNELDL